MNTTKKAASPRLTDRERARLKEAGEELRDIRALCELISHEATESLGRVWRHEDLASIRSHLLDIASVTRYSNYVSEEEARTATLALARKAVR